MTENLKLEFVKRRIKEDILSSDLLTSIFVAAVFSYRHDTVVRPFPPMYLDHDHAPTARHNHLHSRDYTALKDAVSSLEKLPQPNETTLFKRLANCDKSVDLVHWILNTKNFTVRTCDVGTFSQIKKLTGHIVTVAPPNYLFEVCYPSSADEKFNALRNDRNIFYAYHGSRLENFHSILNHGLRGNLSKNAVFGEGTYLSSELSVSLDYSPYGQGWGKSSMGDKLSCVAVCEIIDDESVKCKMHDKTSEEPSTSETSRRSSRSRVKGSIGGDVPEKYYVVRNDDVIRIKYIMVYASRTKPLRQTSSWIRDHKFFLFIMFYVVLLIALGLFKSVAVKSYLRNYMSR